MVPNQNELLGRPHDLDGKLGVSTLCDSGGNPPQKPLGSNSHRYGFDRIKLGLRNSCKSDSDGISCAFDIPRRVFEFRLSLAIYTF